MWNYNTNRYIYGTTFPFLFNFCNTLISISEFEFLFGFFYVTMCLFSCAFIDVYTYKLWNLFCGLIIGCEIFFWILTWHMTSKKTISLPFSSKRSCDIKEKITYQIWNSFTTFDKFKFELSVFHLSSNWK